jgi:preprotein translocase subunit SecF
MRSTDDQLREIMRRAELVKEKRIIKKTILTDVLASCVCLALLIAVAVCLPKLSLALTGSVATQYGSLLLAAPYIGYVIVGLLAFALGVCVTLLCVHWKKWKERERK